MTTRSIPLRFALIRLASIVVRSGGKWTGACAIASVYRAGELSMEE
jgi:hypothetical protein